jgi:ATP-dependent protease Clp ATPase subunit
VEAPIRALGAALAGEHARGVLALALQREHAGTDDALECIAQKAVERKIGARGLRMIMEELMLDMMFTLPSQTDVKEVVVSKEVVMNQSNPLVVMEKAG